MSQRFNFHKAALDNNVYGSLVSDLYHLEAEILLVIRPKGIVAKEQAAAFTTKSPAPL
jgi:hypothetical protein